ncbi:penicillin-binding protein 1C [Reichenbachiella ulvae]|uniref:peptidoglycan glycosyltransferase n=1 Tax=Reichenbachiella ulvae TaxID=2980104 RepID=A0ABT3CXW0_9BACT|nr:penicillin-binding protein 1C [Reichenbachiella ulvae]MCV9388439.1 penicillin-binding protein 1C [Reichenbachiella ulvae]
MISVNKTWNYLKSRKPYQKILLLGLLVCGAVLLAPLPSPVFETPYATTLETRDGHLLGAMIAEDGQWRFPKQDSVPARFAVAIRMFEDEYFPYHFGVNPVSVFKALLTNWEEGRIVRGGSTLSMQVIRLSRNNPPRTLWEKLWETWLVLKLELLYSKSEILDMYAGHAPFGGNVVGLEAAAWRYFGRSPHELSWGETAALAVLPNSPSLVRPGKNETLLAKKRAFLLGKLLDRGVLDSMTYRLALEEDLPGQPRDLPRLAPHLLTRVMAEGHAGERNVVALDERLQRIVVQKANAHSRRMKSNYIHNAAVLVVDLENAKVKAYVGNTDAGDLHGEDVDVIPAMRSTGSLLKPFLYAAAIDQGVIAPQQLTKDYPLIHQGFSPKNFDKTYRGAVAADEALRRSLNLPFVNILMDYGYEAFHAKLQSLGMNSLKQGADHYGLSLILGGSESSLWELTNMYVNLFAVYQNGLDRPVTRSYDRSDYRQITYEASQPAEVLSVDGEPLSISAIWSTLQAMTQLSRPQDYTDYPWSQRHSQIAWKTGTSFGFRDAWAIGLNGKYAVGVWVGNADGEGRPGLVGVQAAAPLMFDVFSVLDGKLELIVPTSETAEFSICHQSGQRAGDYCGESQLMSLPVSVSQSEICTYHRTVHLDSTRSFRVNSSCYPVNQMLHESWFVLPPVQAWYYRRYHSDYQSLPPFLPSCDEALSGKKMSFIYPKNRSRVFIPREIDGTRGKAVFEIAHEDRKEKLYWHLDGEYLEVTTAPHQLGISTFAGQHQLHVVDEDGFELNLNFEVIRE